MKHLFYLLSLFVLSACASSEDGDTDNPNLPGPLQTGRQVSEIVMRYTSYDVPAHDTKVVFHYDADRRVSRMDLTNTIPSEDIEQSGQFDFSYEGNVVTCEASYNYDGEYTKTELNGILGDQSQLLAGSVKEYYFDGETETFVEEISESIQYEVIYDALGYMSSTTCFYNADTDAGIPAREKNYQLSWENGNPTELMWGTRGDDYWVLDCAEYGNVQNKTNLDLSWLLLTTEGWSFMVGDSSNFFGLAGYYGNRSRTMPVKIYYKSPASSDNPIDSFTQITYQLDDEGYIEEITEKYVGSDYEETSVYTISYRN